jgi:hypothetical protein
MVPHYLHNLLADLQVDLLADLQVDLLADLLANHINNSLYSGI